MGDARTNCKGSPPSFPALVQQFFTEYLVAQRALSPRTVACYRDSMTLFLGYATQHLGKPPMAMQLMDITPELILKFLAHLERERHNSVRSRNLRLTALRAFLKFAGRRDVTALHAVERAMSVPMKRFERPLLGHLTRPEMIAVLGQPGTEWTSQRDHLLLSLLYNTGARVSEIVGVRVVDVVLDGAAAIRVWLHANPQLRGSAALLPNRSGHSMTRCNVAQRLALAVKRASVDQPSLKTKRVSPHTLRHTTAMHLLQSGVPFNVNALWLGHESTNTTHRYVEANLEMKEKALARLEAPDIKLKRFRASDDLMKFLQTL
ncbi:MAG: site-specific integrase [Burkholderiales bacterium]|nr:site-specific integrase [Burkholderiales bacterium]